MSAPASVPSMQDQYDAAQTQQWDQRRQNRQQEQQERQQKVTQNAQQRATQRRQRLGYADNPYFQFTGPQSTLSDWGLSIMDEEFGYSTYDAGSASVTTINSRNWRTRTVTSGLATAPMSCHLRR